MVQISTLPLAAWDEYFSAIVSFGKLDDIGIIGTAQTPVAGNDDEQNFSAGLSVARLIPMSPSELLTILRKHFLEFFGIGPHLLYSFLRFSQLCGTHHFHRFGDLLGVLNRFNSVTNFF